MEQLDSDLRPLRAAPKAIYRAARPRDGAVTPSWSSNCGEGRARVVVAAAGSGRKPELIGRTKRVPTGVHAGCGGSPCPRKSR